MFNLLGMILPRIHMFGEDEGGAAPEPTPAPAEPTEPEAEPTPEPEKGKAPESLPPTPDTGADPPKWPGRDDVLKAIQEARKGKEDKGKPKEPAKPEEKKPEETKPGEPKPKEEPKPAEPPKKEFAKPETLLTDIIEGLDAEGFKGKTVKEFAEYVKKTEESTESFEALQGIKDLFDKDPSLEKDFFDMIKKRQTPEVKELKKEDFETDEEYSEAVKKAEAEKANEDRLRKLEEQAQADRNKEFSKTLDETIGSAIKRHTDDVAKRCLLSNEDINSVLKVLGHVPNDVDINVPAIITDFYDGIAKSKKSYAEESVKLALEKAKPEHIKEYLGLKEEQQKKLLNSMGTAPAPEFAKPEAPLNRNDLDSGKVKQTAIQFVKERWGKK